MRVRYWILVVASILGIFSCDKKGSNQDLVVGTEYIKGTCFDKVISPYVYQIAEIEGTKVFYFAMEKTSKEVMSSTIDELFKGEDPFHIVDCP